MVLLTPRNLFVFAIIALIITAIVVFSDMMLLSASRTMPYADQKEGFTFMDALAESVKKGNPPSDQGSGSGNPPSDQGSGSGNPPSDQGSGSGNPPNNQGSGSGNPPSNQGSGSGNPPSDQGSGTQSNISGFRNIMEGFAGPALGAGTPNCMHTSKDAAALHELLTRRVPDTEEGPADLREITVILSKISCFKRDLMGAAGVVEATRYQPFATSHDLEPVAETTARCFAKTIPQRDLALSLDKWGARGTFLIKRLCTSERLSDAEEKEALRLFGGAMMDINDVALGRCCNSDAGVIAGQKQVRMVGGFEPATNVYYGQYGGYY